MVSQTGFLPIYVDLDALTRVNDVHGCGAGDAVIQALGWTLLRQLGDRAIRWKGGQFLVLYEGPDAPAQAEALRAAVAATRVPLPYPEQEDPVGITVTVAVLEGWRADPSEAFRRLDVALYDARPGADRVLRLG